MPPDRRLDVRDGTAARLLARFTESLAVRRLARQSEADLRGHLAGEPVPAKRINAPVIKPAPGKKYDDFQLAYALDLVNGKMTVASATETPTSATRAPSAGPP